MEIRVLHKKVIFIDDLQDNIVFGKEGFSFGV